jgi:hypothetical protein
VGLPKSALAVKMLTDGVVPTKELAIAILEKRRIDPAELGKPRANVSLPPASPTSNDEPDASGKICLKDHPQYGKFFKMIKAGIPVVSVKTKAEQAGLDPSVLDRDPSERVMSDFASTDKAATPKEKPKETSKLALEANQVEANPPDDVSAAAAASGGSDSARAGGAGEMVAIKDHPVYAKFIRMLKVGLPLVAVKNKMEQENLDPSIIDKDPETMVPLNASPPVEMVALQDHPVYQKYLKMLKVGLPLPAAKQKMQDDGFDPSILDKKGSEMVALNPSLQAAPPPKPNFKLPKKGSPESKVRKKKLHWKGLDSSKVTGSLWAEDEEDDESFQLDETEFNMLFVQK